MALEIMITQGYDKTLFKSLRLRAHWLILVFTSRRHCTVMLGQKKVEMMLTVVGQWNVGTR